MTTLLCGLSQARGWHNRRLMCPSFEGDAINCSLHSTGKRKRKASKTTPVMDRSTFLVSSATMNKQTTGDSLASRPDYIDSSHLYFFVQEAKLKTFYKSKQWSILIRFAGKLPSISELVCTLWTTKTQTRSACC